MELSERAKYLERFDIDEYNKYSFEVDLCVNTELEKKWKNDKNFVTKFGGTIHNLHVKSYMIDLLSYDIFRFYNIKNIYVHVEKNINEIFIYIDKIDKNDEVIRNMNIFACYKNDCYKISPINEGTKWKIETKIPGKNITQ